MTIDDQIKCAKRELAFRRSAYPKWVASGRMKQEAADKEIEGMAAIVATLEKIQKEVAVIVKFAEAIAVLGTNIEQFVEVFSLLQISTFDCLLGEQEEVKI